MDEEDLLWLLQNFEWFVLVAGAGVIAWMFHLRRVALKKNRKA
jgi:hypothetical protein